jgi:DNA polymerase III subunit gamma/tau
MIENTLDRIATALESIAITLGDMAEARIAPVVYAETTSAPAAVEEAAPAPVKEKKPRAKKAEAEPAPTMVAQEPTGYLQAAQPHTIGDVLPGAATAPAAQAPSPAPFAAAAVAEGLRPNIKAEAMAFMPEPVAAAPVAPAPTPAAPVMTLEPAVLAAVSPAPVPAFTPQAAAVSVYDAMVREYPGAFIPSQHLPAEVMADLPRWEASFASAPPDNQIAAITQIYMQAPGNPATGEALKRSLAWFGKSLPISQGAAAPSKAGDTWINMPQNQRFVTYLQLYIAANAAKPAGI